MPDELIVEEPLEIRLDDQLVGTTMRTPGPRLRAGRRLLLHRRAPRRGARAGRPLLRHRLGGRDRVQRGDRRDRRAGAGAGAAAQHDHVVLRAVRLPDPRRARRPAGPAPPARALVPSRCWPACPTAVRARQELFDRTGAVHAAAAFDRRRRGAGGARGHRPPQRRRQGRRPPAARRARCRRATWGCSSAGGPASRWCRRRGPPASRPSWRCQRPVGAGGADGPTARPRCWRASPGPTALNLYVEPGR